MTNWKFIPTEYTWELYRNGKLYFTFGLGNTEYKVTDLFEIEDKHDPQEVLDLVLELIYEIEDETEIYFLRDSNGYDNLVDCMFSTLAKAFGGVR